jgi:hypothetical protein
MTTARRADSAGRTASDCPTLAYPFDRCLRKSPNRPRIIEKVVAAALGSIPWIGGFIGAAVATRLERPIYGQTGLHTQWLEEHARKINKLMLDLQDITNRLESLVEQIDERI